MNNFYFERALSDDVSILYKTFTLSRKHEFEADSYAAENAEASQLISALIKLYKENSAPVITNKWFSLFYDSHPNALARIDALE